MAVPTFSGVCSIEGGQCSRLFEDLYKLLSEDASPGLMRMYMHTALDEAASLARTLEEKEHEVGIRHATCAFTDAFSMLAGRLLLMPVINNAVTR
jgi:hypothetical protein